MLSEMPNNARARSDVYNFIARGFRPPSASLFAGRDDDAPLQRVAKALAVLEAPELQQDAEQLSQFSGRNAASGQPAALQELAVEYNRLFVGPAPPLAYPYESVYQHPEGLVMGAPALQVLERYAEEGLSLSRESRELPDHVAVELEFMAYLCERELQAHEAGEAECAAQYIEKEHRFLADHLLKWVPAFCDKIICSSDSVFYIFLARMAKDFLRWDMENLCRQMQARSQIGSRRETEASGPALARAGRPSIRGEKEYYWQAEIRQDNCTLCGICEQECRPGALQVCRDSAGVSLYFESLFCDGCRLCVKFCPEKTLHIRALPVGSENGPPPQRQALLRSALLSCPQCGTAHISAASTRQILKRLSDLPNAARLTPWVSLCLPCKRALAGKGPMSHTSG